MVLGGVRFLMSEVQLYRAQTLWNLVASTGVRTNASRGVHFPSIECEYGDKVAGLRKGALTDAEERKGC